MMSLTSKLVLGIVCSAALGAPAMMFAQAPAAATTTVANASGTKVHGTIMDPDGELIPGATIQLTPAKGAAISVKSGDDGTYSAVVPPGSYTLVVTMKGFASYVAQNVKIAATAGMTLDAKLKVGVETEVVNVDANAVTLSVDADSNASSTIITGKDLEALSDDPDELSSELSALAGPSAGPNGGQIYVDGFTGGQLPPKSSIREIRINQNPFSAQFDRLGFGRVEVFTKPGTDKIHGSFQMNGDPSQFDTRNPLISAGTYVPPYHTLFMFGSFTGPLAKWASYSIGGSHRDIEDDSFTNAYLYSTSAGVLCPPGLNAGCTVAGTTPNYQASTYTPQIRTDISPRFDFAIGAKNVLTTRFQFVQNDQLSQGVGNLVLPSAAYNSSQTSTEVQLSDTQTLSSKMINETRFEYEREHSKTNALSSAPTVGVSGAFTAGGSGRQNSSDHQDHYEVQNYTSIALKKNFIRFGGRLRSNREAENTQSGTNGSFSYASLAYTCVGTVAGTTTPCVTSTTGQGTSADHSYASGSPQQFSKTVLNIPTVRINFTDVGLYLEDDWKARPNLSLSYGIRWETQNNLGDHTNFAPRLSVSYGVGNGKGNPKTVLRGGFGMFYDRFGQGSILNLALNGQTNPVQTVYQVSNPGAGCDPSAANPLVACGATATTTAVTSKSANLRAPYIIQFALGADQTVGKIGTISVNYLHSNGVHQFAQQNAYYGISTIRNSQYFSEGTFEQNQVILNARAQTSKYVSLFGYYSLSFANGTTNGTLSQPGNLAADRGRTSFDTRSRVFLGGSVSLPRHIQFSPFMTGASGAPFNLTTGLDNNNDGYFNDRPYLAPSGTATNGTTIKSIAGCGTFAAPGSQPTGSSIVPINYCTGPSQFTFNMRLTKTFGFGGAKNAQVAGAGGDGGGRGNRGGGMPGGPGGPGGGGPGGGGRGGGGGGMMGGGGGNTGQRFNVTFGVGVNNLFANKDLSSPGGVLSSPNFGQSTQLAGQPYTSSAATRRISLQASFNF